MTHHKKDITFYKLRLSLLRALCGTTHLLKLSLQLLGEFEPERGSVSKAVLSAYKVWWIRLKNLCFMTNVFAKHKLKNA